MAIGAFNPIAEYCAKNKEACTSTRPPDPAVRALYEKLHAAPTQQCGAQENPLRGILTNLVEMGKRLAGGAPPAGTAPSCTPAGTAPTQEKPAATSSSAGQASPAPDGGGDHER